MQLFSKYQSITKAAASCAAVCTMVNLCCFLIVAVLSLHLNLRLASVGNQLFWTGHSGEIGWSHPRKILQPILALVLHIFSTFSPFLKGIDALQCCWTRDKNSE
jgi:hypothetical protein